jgi:hypothetical protein
MTRDSAERLSIAVDDAVVAMLLAMPVEAAAAILRRRPALVGEFALEVVARSKWRSDRRLTRAQVRRAATLIRLATAWAGH